MAGVDADDGTSDLSAILELAVALDAGLIFFAKECSGSMHTRRVYHDLSQCLCAGLDSNQRRPKSRDLQSRAFDHSATDA